MFLLALKNTLFYKSRSLSTITLTFISTLFFILYVAVMDGSHNSMLKNALKVYTGAIEVYKKGYRDEGGNEYLIRDLAAVEKVIQKIDGVSSFSARYETYGLLSFEDSSTAVMLAGVEAKKEAEITRLKEALVEGEYLKKDGGNCLYLGIELSNKLHVKLGQSVSFIGSASDNSFVAELLSVCGIFKTGLFAFDASSAFVSKNYFDTLMSAQNMASYITVQPEHLKDIDKIQKNLENSLDKSFEVLSYKRLMKPMVEAMQVDSVFGYISMSLFFVVIFFVIMIFGFINVSARVKEFGVLRCIGLSRRDIRALLFYEIFILATLGVLLATPIGIYTAYYFHLHPFIIEGMSETYKEYGIVSDEIPLSFDLWTIAWNVAVVYLVDFLSIVYPMSYINSFEPIEATQHV